MFAIKPSTHHDSIAEHAAESAEQALLATQRAASDALDTLAMTVGDLRHQAAPLLRRANASAIALARQGVGAFRGGSRQLRDKAVRASDRTLDYVKDEPVKSMLIAAAAGAALVALFGFIARDRR